MYTLLLLPVDREELSLMGVGGLRVSREWGLGTEERNGRG